MIDFDALAIDPAVRRLGQILREEYGVWVGLLRPDGGATVVGAEAYALDRPICQLYMANTLGEGESAYSCRASMEQWGARDREAERDDPVKRCHAALHALSVPVEVDGEFIGSVYVSGFVPAERSMSALEKVEDTLQANELGQPDEREEMLQTVPKLDKAERGCVLALLRGIAEHVADSLRETEEEPEPDAGRYGEMIGTSPAMEKLFATLRKISRSDSTVLIQGENGTGKELIARAIHRHSRRRDKPFIVQNCAAIPAELIASELFGHRKGAFSGAHRDRDGLFEAADHGTFFLDEIGEMDVSLQVKLLRVLQEGTFLPVGDNRYRKVDVRILCATNQDLEQLVDDGKFREDLYYRINVITVEAPPLRRRPSDIPILARHFLARAAREHGRPPKELTDEALDVLKSHDWPGNVRQLENEIQRAVIMTGDGDTIDAEDLSVGESEDAEPGLLELARPDLELPEAIERLERHMILAGLRRTGWNKTQTARDLGVSRRNLIRKVASYELEKYRSD